MMKKTFTLLLALLLVASLLASCTSGATSSEAPSTAVETPAPASPAKLGLAVLTNSAKSADVGEKDGAAKSNSVVAALLLDGEGRILACKLDTLQSTIEFSSEGKLLTDLATTFQTKQQLKEEYGMKKASKIGKEWYEQANALSEYVIGKTLAEVKGIALDDKGVAADAALAASVTVKLGDYLEAIEQAINNAVETSATTSDLLGIAVVNNIAKSKDAGEKDGLAQTYSTYAAVTVGANGKLTGCILDATQANVNFDANGKITSDIAAPVKTKNELAADYGMQKVSKIGKEWNEQAAAYAAYVVGKTADEVAGIAVNDSGKATDAELLASVTVTVGDFNEVVAQAAANAK